MQLNLFNAVFAGILQWFPYGSRYYGCRVLLRANVLLTSASTAKAELRRVKEFDLSDRVA
jgi:hypothetical protein